jgi:hypothetical protein
MKVALTIRSSVRVDRSRYNNTFVRTPVSKTSRSTVIGDLVVVCSCRRHVATQGEVYEGVYHHSTPSPVITFVSSFFYRSA